MSVAAIAAEAERAGGTSLSLSHLLDLESLQALLLLWLVDVHVGNSHFCRGGGGRMGVEATESPQELHLEGLGRARRQTPSPPPDAGMGNTTSATRWAREQPKE